MVLFVIGIVITLALFLILGINYGTVVEWKLNKKQLLAILGLCFVLMACYVSVPTGHTGVVTTFGKVENFTLEAGVHFKLPWQDVIKMDNRVQKSTLDMSCFSSDVLHLAYP